MAAYLDYTRSDGVVLPAEGPPVHQAHQWDRARRLADAERAAIEKERSDQEQAMAAVRGGGGRG